MSDTLQTQTTFADLGLAPSVYQGVDDMGFDHPTEIQAQLIPLILAGKDVIGQARTGTGKTAAFGLPLLHLADPDQPMATLVLAPTRELAAQVAAELEQLAKHTDIKVACIVGGESFDQQEKALKGGANIIVGTPGRIMDLRSRRMLSFDRIQFAILDEVDRMLDIGFRDDIKRILGDIKSDHQTVFVSATVTPDIEILGRSFMHEDAQIINVVSGSLTVEQVDQKYLSVEPWDKRALLLKLLVKEKPETTVVFCRTKHTVRKIAEYLGKKDIAVREIHGDLHQSKRNRVMNSMRQGQVDVLVASDLAARGLDVEHITHVINYDLPDDPEIYVHRIGRTARAGRRGIAWSFVTPEEGQTLTEIEKLAGTLIEKLEYPDFTPGRVPDDVREERDRAAKHQTAAPAKHSTRQLSPDLQGLSEDELKAMFPGGKIPSSAPKKGLGGKFKRRGR